MAVLAALRLWLWHWRQREVAMARVALCRVSRHPGTGNCLRWSQRASRQEWLICSCWKGAQQSFKVRRAPSYWNPIRQSPSQVRFACISKQTIILHRSALARLENQLLFCSFFFRAAPTACGGSRARGRIGAVAADLHHSHSNTGSELRLRPTPQLMATPDP